MIAVARAGKGTVLAGMREGLLRPIAKVVERPIAKAVEGTNELFTIISNAAAVLSPSQDLPVFKRSIS